MFESIMNSCPRKKVVSLCKKLIKKCSFNSGEDARNLCSLGYRLFIYGHIDEALAVSRYTHNVPFPGRGVFNVWTFILCLWGLEVFILKAQGKYAQYSQQYRHRKAPLFLQTQEAKSFAETAEDPDSAGVHDLCVWEYLH